MSATPAPPDPAAEDAALDRAVLNAFLAAAEKLVNLALAQAEAATLSVPEASKAYDRITKSARRSMWLKRKLAEPVKTIDRTAARKQIIRVVEDNIQRHAEPGEAEILHDELLDRLDTPDLEDEIRFRPVDDIITDIIRDLGLAALPGNDPWKRRMRDDLTLLRARATAPPGQTGRQAAGYSLAWNPPEQKGRPSFSVEKEAKRLLSVRTTTEVNANG